MPRPFSSSDEQWMAHALALARRGEALASPNPMVGAVLVRNQRVVGEGFHTYDALKHAEIIALEAAGSAARRATLYVNLEPCCITGRTGPCTQALIQGGVARVVAAMPDPNPADFRARLQKNARRGNRSGGGQMLRGSAAPKRSLRDVDHYATAAGDAEIRDDARRQSGSAGRGRGTFQRTPATMDYLQRLAGRGAAHAPCLRRAAHRNRHGFGRRSHAYR